MGSLEDRSIALSRSLVPLPHLFREENPDFQSPQGRTSLFVQTTAVGGGGGENKQSRGGCFNYKACRVGTKVEIMEACQPSLGKGSD